MSTLSVLVKKAEEGSRSYYKSGAQSEGNKRPGPLVSCFAGCVAVQAFPALRLLTQLLKCSLTRRLDPRPRNGQCRSRVVFTSCQEKWVHAQDKFWQWSHAHLRCLRLSPTQKGGRFPATPFQMDHTCITHGHFQRVDFALLCAYCALPLAVSDILFECLCYFEDFMYI